MIRLWHNLGVLQPNDGPLKFPDLFENTIEIERVLRSRGSVRGKIKPEKIRAASIMGPIQRGFSRGISSEDNNFTSDPRNLIGGTSWGDDTRTDIEVR